MSLYSGEVYRRFPKTFGVDAGVRPERLPLPLHATRPRWRRRRRACAFQQEEGVHDVRALAPAEVGRAPGPRRASSRRTTSSGATWCPSDGFLRPTEIARAFADGARDARRRRSTSARGVTAIERAGGRAVGRRRRTASTAHRVRRARRRRRVVVARGLRARGVPDPRRRGEALPLRHAAVPRRGASSTSRSSSPTSGPTRAPSTTG